MKTIFLQSLLVLQFLLTSHSIFSQGWVAEVDLDLNHNLYAFEMISKASLTFSGVTVTGSSQTSQLQLVIRGSGPMSGDITLSINGVAWEPYDRTNPQENPISAFFSGRYSTPCETGFFEKKGSTPDEQVYIWIKIYPRMEISNFLQKCDEIVLTTNTCSQSFFWEVNDNVTGAFKPITGKSTSSISITREELINLGFSSPYGRKYFRVTGLFNTTSQLQAIDIYYPGPIASLTPIAPKCHESGDGQIRIDITSATPQINDFVVTLFEIRTSTNPVRQDFILDGSHIVFNSLSSGNYKVRIENYSSIDIYGNCWVDYEFGLKDPDPISIVSAKMSDVNGYQLACKGDSDGYVEIMPAGGTGTFDAFQWTPTISTSARAEGLAEGTYKVRVRDSNQCWSPEYSYTIAAPEKLALHLQSAGGKNGYDISCMDKKDGEIHTDVQGGRSPYSFKWSDGSSEPILKGLGPGSYQVTVSDANGCIADQSIDLTAPEAISFLIQEIQPVACPGQFTGSLEVQSIKNTIGEISYSWSSGERERTITDKSSGTYTAKVSDAQGCSTSASHTLLEPAGYSVKIIPSSDFNGAYIRCNGEDNGRLTAIVHDQNNLVTKADSYTWKMNENQLSSGATLETIKDLSAGIYHVEIKYRAVCSAEHTFVLTEPDSINVSISNNSNYNGVPISCAEKKDGSIVASASGGTGKTYNYLWSGGEKTSTLEDIGAGAYSVLVTDINGCKGSAKKTLIEPKALSSGITILSNYHGQPISCTDADDGQLRASVEGGTPPFFYTWNTGSEIPELTSIRAGKYILNIRDANGCTSVSNINVPNPAPVIAKISEASNYHGYGVTCYGESDGYLVAAGEGGTGTYTFRWQEEPVADSVISNLPKGNYSVIVTDENGCTNSISHLISEPTVLSLNIETIIDVSCNEGSDGEIHLFAKAGAGGYKYSVINDKWKDETIFAGLQAGAYQPTVMDINGCMVTMPATIAQPEPVTIRFTNIEPALCGDSRGKVAAIVSGGTGGYQYMWKDSQGQIAGITAEISDVSAGVYTLFAVDDNLCKTSSPVGVPASDGPKAVVNEVTATTCSYTHDGKALVSIVEGDGPFTFRWQDGQQTAEATNLAKGNYLVEVKDFNNCLTVESATVPGPDTLEIALIEKVDASCYSECDGKLTVAAQGGNGNYSFTWQDTNLPTIERLCAGTYTVTVTDKENCVSAGSYVITQPEPITTTVLFNVPPTCHGGCDGQLSLKASGGTGTLQFKWGDGQTESLRNNLCAGTYTTTISDANRCEIESSYILQDPEERMLELGSPVILCKGQTHNLDAGPNWKQYLWQSNTGFKSTSRQVQLIDAGVYSLEAFDNNGCVVRDTFILETSDSLLNSNFLMTTEALVGDTLVVIDISWPLPEHISWVFPDKMKRLNDLGDICYGQFDTPGIFDVTLRAILGECQDELTKSVTIIDNGLSDDEGGRLGSTSFVKVFTLYPNPNDGLFDIVVEFQDESPITLTIWNVLTSKKIAQLEEIGNKYYSKHIDLRPLSAGPYAVRLDHRQGTQYIRFIAR